MHFEYNPYKFDNPVSEEPEPPKKQWIRRKRWKIAKRHHMGKLHEGSNILVEKHFMEIRNEVKRLYAQLNEYFYDKDEREDLTESTVSMHTIACSSLFMILDCSHCHEYEIEYHIEDSPFKEEIKALLRTAGKPKLMEPNMAAYFQYMRSYYNDNPDYFSYLKPEDEQ
jgi:hypothetical protein